MCLRITLTKSDSWAHEVEDLLSRQRDKQCVVTQLAHASQLVLLEVKLCP